MFLSDDDVNSTSSTVPEEERLKMRLDQEWVNALMEKERLKREGEMERMEKERLIGTAAKAGSEIIVLYNVKSILTDNSI